jgi:hypothetical protein
MKITSNQKRWLLKKVDGVWCKAVSREEGGYSETILRLKETSEMEFSELADADSYTSLDVAHLLDLIHDILPDDFVADVRAAKKIVGEDGIPVGVFAKNGDATNVGCKGVFGHDLDWSEIYLANVTSPPTGATEKEVES